ncbi:MAG: gamma-glutamyl-gamma-aminobutyrate hydrolase family protein [Candidatus Paracaedimonas acanthamoebae]|uniref:Gamma-glutamyl-gamma-aminobutyrate hydrolase family protein n=1 Tax=Candidatus Paracaedimonas acanthamoebae TaxID=244581 RepID=A0A8J7Q0X2_9PROT|nr:gamma-glutamyl-gamma-aminobutyrate hydrolase family protein [Candidatus Paracaedimonas acanthamoebae]
MKKFYLAILTVLFLLNLSKTYANDYNLIRDYMLAENQKGKKQSYFAEKLDISEATISRFLNKKVETSPKLLEKFKSKLPKTYQKLITPQKLQATKQIKKKANFPVKKLIFKEEGEKHIPQVPLQTKEGASQKKLSSALAQMPVKVNSTLSVMPFNKPSEILAQKKKINQEDKAKKAPIVIAFREEGDGKGALYDHYTVQRITKYPTQISAHENMRTKKLTEYQRTVTYSLTYGNKHNGQIIPETINNAFEGGLLFIPGRARVNEFDSFRKEHEENLLKQAFLRGQPILAICAGSWRLWESLGGKLEEVEDHCYGGGMIRISETTGEVGYNKQIHRVKVHKDTLLRSIMGTAVDERPSVNSLHWKAPSSKKIPTLAKISAISVADNKIAPNTRQGEQMSPEEGTIEAFENMHGAPFLGIQWHPEAYTRADSEDMVPEKHLAILEYMAKAGQAYHHKRLMLKELEELTLKN